MPDAPAVVLVAITLSAALLLVEVALPTFGVAGVSALGLAVLAAGSADDQHHQLWPLLAVAAAVCLWAALLFARRRSAVTQAVAAGLFATGSVGYGLLAGDAATVALAAAASAGLPFAFRPLMGSASRLAELPPQIGMESLPGHSGTVVAWDGGSGTVRIDGSLWNARSDVGLSPGSEVVVQGSTGMTVHVVLCAAVP